MDPTVRTRLGRSQLTVTRLGLGLAPIGGLYHPGSDEQARATIDLAWESGIRLFDTAPLYGYGLSERRTGAALAGRPRDEYVLATKVGRLLEPGDETQEFWAEVAPGLVPRFDFSAAGVRQSLVDSLDRLGLDRVDILHLHDPDDHYESALKEAQPVLAELRAGGVIGAVGAGMNQSEMLTRFATEAPGGFDCFLLAGRYTLLEQPGLVDLLPRCAADGISVICGGVYNSGVLADPYRNSNYNYAPAPEPVLAKARAMAAVCERFEVPLRAAAIQFPFGHPAVASVVIGVESPEQVADNVAMFRHPVPSALWAALKDEGLLAAHVPTPH